MNRGYADLDALAHDDLLAVAHDYMMTGMMSVRSSLGPLLMAAERIDEPETLSIDQWMGASPVYTHRLRALMGIEGHDVTAIMKALQLDVGFVHGYMDVAYEIRDETYSEFWLLHCGALLDAEPAGEDQVRFMCHDIEDPTFDATALATNPKARIRPIHRPPRTPADRHPHCHWTLIIDDDNEPIGPIAHTDAVRAVALATVPNTVVTSDDDGLADYRGPFVPGFRLTALTHGALAAVTREFQIQAHLLAASIELAVADRSDRETARVVSDDGWAVFGWLLADRLSRALDLGDGPDMVARTFELTAALPPGFERTVMVEGSHVRLTLTPTHDGIGDPEHPGWVGSLARGATSGIEGTLGGIGYAAANLTAHVEDGIVVHEFDLTAAAGDRSDFVAIASMGRAPTWPSRPTNVEIRR